MYIITNDYVLDYINSIDDNYCIGCTDDCHKCELKDFENDK